MSFQIYSDIADRIVSVQVDDQGTFDVVGDVNHKKTVPLSFAKVHVNGDGITQAPCVAGIEANSCYKVWILNAQVRVDPSLN